MDVNSDVVAGSVNILRDGWYDPNALDCPLTGPDEAFPFLSAGMCCFFDGRLSSRLFRISFSSRFAYELAIPAGCGERRPTH